MIWFLHSNASQETEAVPINHAAYQNILLTCLLTFGHLQILFAKHRRECHDESASLLRSRTIKIAQQSKIPH